LNILKLVFDEMNGYGEWKEWLPRRCGIILVLAAKHGKSDILRWILNLRAPEYGPLNDACALAALRGNETCFEMCLEFRPSLSMASAIKGGNEAIVDATAERVSSIDARDFALAAKLGSVTSLASMLRFSSSWDETTTATASRFGHVECLRFAHENGCQWTETALATTHKECFDYATEHGAGTASGCRCIVVRKGKLENGMFFKNRDPPKDAPYEEVLEQVDEGSRNWAKQARLYSALQRPVLTRDVESFVDAMEPTKSVFLMACFMRGVYPVGLNRYTSLHFYVRDSPYFKKEIRHKRPIMGSRWRGCDSLEGAAFRHETGSPESHWVGLELYWAEEHLILTMEGGEKIAWKPEDDMLYCKLQKNRCTLPRSKLVFKPELYNKIYRAACFFLNRSFEDACSMFCRQPYKKFTFPIKYTKCHTVEEVFQYCQDEHPRWLPLKSMSRKIAFVKFLREHQISVTSDIARSVNFVKKWKTPTEFGVDQWCFKNGILYDIRSRMKTPVVDLLERAPPQLLPVLYYATRTRADLDSFYRDVASEPRSSDLSGLASVTALEYCRHAIF